MLLQPPHNGLAVVPVKAGFEGDLVAPQRGYPGSLLGGLLDLTTQPHRGAYVLSRLTHLDLQRRDTLVVAVS